MSDSKANPKGLKDQEVERGSVKKRPPIPYVPVVDEVQDALNKSKGKEATFMIKLPDKMEFTVSIWDAGTPKPFLIMCRQLSMRARERGCSRITIPCQKTRTSQLQQPRASLTS